MSTSEDTIYANFAPCPLVPCNGIPSREFLLDVNKYINEQTVDVFSFRGCGTLGHLVLSAQPTVFALQCATVFIPPTNPGATPIIPDPAPIAAVLAAIVTNQKSEKKYFVTFEAVDAACKKVLQYLVPPKFYKSLGNRVTGFKRVSFLAIFSHLLTEYGELEDHETPNNSPNHKARPTPPQHYRG